MKRQCGRYPNKEYYLEIERLPDGQLFSPSEITRRKYDKKTQPELYTKMFHAIYQFGFRNGLALFPDNGLRQPNGKPMMANGKAKLRPGVRSARWTGATWKSHLYADDHEAIKRYAQQKLARTLRVALEWRQRTQTAPPEHVQAPKPRWFGFKPRMRLLAAALVVGLVLTAGALYNHNHLRQGMDILRSDGPQAALSFFQNHGETYDHMFGTAWAAYRNGDYRQAEELSHKIMQSPALNDRARANYLLGDMMTIRGEYDKAHEYLLTALALYETTGKAYSQYRTYLFLAKLYVTQKQSENAVYYLNLAELTRPSAKDHYPLYLKSQVAFLKNDYEGALATAKQRVSLVKGNTSQLGGIYGDIGFYSGLIGNLDDCLKFTMKAQNIAQEIDSQKMTMYNNINMCLFLKCSLKDYEYLRDTVLNYSQRHGDAKLAEYMYFVDKFACAIPRPDPGDGEPPDEPPPDPPQTRMQPELKNLQGNFSSPDPGNR